MDEERGTQLRQEAARLLADIAAGEPIGIERCFELARAVMETEVVAHATRVLDGDRRFVLRNAIAVASAIVAAGACAVEDEGEASGDVS